MTNFNIGLSTNSKIAYVTMGSDALPVEATNVLDDFEHVGEDDSIHEHDANHVLFHHVRDALYHEGLLDMQAVSIVKHGDTINSTGFYADPEAIEVIPTGDDTFVVKHKHNDAVAVDLVVVIDDTNTATYSFPGSVHTITGVADGTTFATVTSTVLGFSVVIPITVATP